MAKGNFKFEVSKADLRKLEKQVDTAIDNATADTYTFFKNETPVRGGNARNKTKYKKSNTQAVINANYPYSKRLDEGYSKQAPRGMSKPSLKQLERELSNEFRRI